MATIGVMLLLVVVGLSLALGITALVLAVLAYQRETPVTTIKAVNGFQASTGPHLTVAVSPSINGLLKAVETVITEAGSEDITGAVLTGLTVPSSIHPVVATSTVLSAFQNVQGTLNRSNTFLFSVYGTKLINSLTPVSLFGTSLPIVPLYPAACLKLGTTVQLNIFGNIALGAGVPRTAPIELRYSNGTTLIVSDFSPTLTPMATYPFTIQSTFLFDTATHAKWTSVFTLMDTTSFINASEGLNQTSLFAVGDQITPTLFGNVTDAADAIQVDNAVAYVLFNY